MHPYNFICFSGLSTALKTSSLKVITIPNVEHELRAYSLNLIKTANEKNEGGKMYHEKSMENQLLSSQGHADLECVEIERRTGREIRQQLVLNVLS